MRNQAAYTSDTPLVPFSFERRVLRTDDVAIEILYCGVCHSDLHTARNDWGWSYYPIVPDHEIVGRVAHFVDARKLNTQNQCCGAPNRSAALWHITGPHGICCRPVLIDIGSESNFLQ